MRWHSQLWPHGPELSLMRCVAHSKQPTLSSLSLCCGLDSNTTLKVNGGAHSLPEPVDQDLGVHVLHGEDVAWREPARQVLGGQSEERVINRQDA